MLLSLRSLWEATSASVTATPGTASLVLTGFAPTVSSPRLVTPATDALVLATFAPTVLAPRVVTPAAQILSLTGFAPAVATPRVVTPATLAVTVTGFAPTVTATANTGITPGTIALALSGFAPTVTASAATASSGGGGQWREHRRWVERLPISVDPRLVTPITGNLALRTFPPEILVSDWLEEDLPLWLEVLSAEDFAAFLAA